MPRKQRIAQMVWQARVASHHLIPTHAGEQQRDALLVEQAIPSLRQAARKRQWRGFADEVSNWGGERHMGAAVEFMERNLQMLSDGLHAFAFIRRLPAWIHNRHG